MTQPNPDATKEDHPQAKTNTQANTQAKFLTGSLTRHILTMSVTSGIGFIALFLVDLVDMLFISMLGVAELAAAVGFAGTILFVTTSVSIGVAIAAGALVARALGQGQPERATQLLTHVLLIGVGLAIAIAALIYGNLFTVTGWIGATGETRRLAVGYLQILIPTMPVMLVGMVASAALRSHGAARLSMMVTLLAGIVNAVLDPILIFGLDLGLQGAALASAMARLTMAGVALWYILRRFGGLARLQAGDVLRDLLPIAAIALPAILTNIATPVGAAYVTRAAASFGEAAVAGMAVIGRVTPVAFALIFAISGAIGPIIGQNHGAGRPDRVRSAFYSSLQVIVLYVIPVVALLWLLRAPIADMFGATGLARDLIFLFCGPLSLAWIFNGLIFVANAAFNNLGHPFYSTGVNWGRNTLGVVPFVYFGALIWGAEGVLIGQMVGGVFAALIALLLAEAVLRRSEHPDPGREPDSDAFDQEERPFKILHHRR